MKSYNKPKRGEIERKEKRKILYNKKKKRKNDEKREIKDGKWN